MRRQWEIHHHTRVLRRSKHEDSTHASEHIHVGISTHIYTPTVECTWAKLSETTEEEEQGRERIARLKEMKGG